MPALPRLFLLIFLSAGPVFWVTSIPTSLSADTTLLESVTSITVGANHACVLTADGGVKCWGKNSLGYLGDRTTIDRAGAVDVLGLPGEMVKITTGFGNTCGLAAAGTVWCWGSNRVGELGIGTSDSRPHASPVSVKGLAEIRIVDVATGYEHACAVAESGMVYCWGGNDFGQLGVEACSSRASRTQCYYDERVLMRHVLRRAS